jgi:hypothetical protein
MLACALVQVALAASAVDPIAWVSSEALEEKTELNLGSEVQEQMAAMAVVRRL